MTQTVQGMKEEIKKGKDREERERTREGNGGKGRGGGDRKGRLGRGGEER